MLEIIPIGAVLSLITTQVLETARAAEDVLVEKESFRIVAQHLLSIQPALSELQKQNVQNSPAVRYALKALQEDIKKARNLIDRCITKPRFYLLVNCRSIVREAQEIIQDLGKDLQVLSLASLEVSVDIQENVQKLQDEMVNTELRLGNLFTSTMTKLELGIREHRTDQGFANDLIFQIAHAVGVPVETTEIRKELASFKKEKDEAAARKERSEEMFMEQVLVLLSRADVAYNPEATAHAYKERAQSISRYYCSSSGDDDDNTFPPLQAFLCPLKMAVMNDPVMLQSGRTYEREDIKRWFDAGHKTDPVTKEELSDLSMHPNVPLRQSIVEWVERNYCLSIRHVKHMIETGNEAKQRTGFAKLQSLCEENRVNKGWIVAEDGLLSTIVGVLKSQSREIKRDALLTLFMIVKNHVSNKEMVAEVGGVEQIVRCLARDMSVARPAVVLLHELAQDGKGGNITSVRVKLESDRSAILCLVTLATGRDPEAATSARFVLQPLSDRDENVIQMAKANWFPPLIARLREGSAASKLAMAKVVAEMELTADGKQKMVEQGAVALLVNISMEKSNVEVTAAALGALDRLSFMSQSKSYFVDAGTVPAVLHHLFAGWSHPNIQEIAASILKNLAAEDGTDYFLDSSGAPLELELHIQNLLSMQESMVCSHVVRKHLLGALLGMAAKPNAVKLRTLICTQQGIPRLLSIIRRVEKDTRDCIIHLLWHLSDEGGTQIAALVHGQQLADDFVLWLKERGKDNIQVAAAGILANLPLEDEVLTRSLVDAGVLSELVSVLQRGNEKAQESAISALMRFTDASNIEIQQALASLDILPLLVTLLSSGTAFAKTKAAMALRNFSISTTCLSVEPPMTLSCLCFSPAQPSVCRVHLGNCDVRTTFCLVKAEAIPALVLLVKEKAENGASDAAINALATLVGDDQIRSKGAHLLHESNAIEPMIELLLQGSADSQERLLTLLEMIFSVKGIREFYCEKARIPLVHLTAHGTLGLRKKAAHVLAQLGMIQETSTYF